MRKYLYDYAWARYDEKGKYLDNNFYQIINQKGLYNSSNVRIGDMIEILFDTNKMNDSLNIIYCSAFIIDSGKKKLIETKSLNIKLEDKQFRLIIENDNDNLYMYQVINFTSSTEFSLSLKQKIILDSAYRNPLKIGYKGTHLYLIVKNIGLVECSFINGSNSVSYNILSTTEAEKNIFDFVINEYSIYAISKGIGLYIYDLSFSVIKTVLYKHQFIKEKNLVVKYSWNYYSLMSSLLFLIKFSLHVAIPFYIIL